MIFKFKLNLWFFLIILQYEAFLKVIKEASKALESSKSILDNALPTLDFLIKQFKAGKAAY